MGIINLKKKMSTKLSNWLNNKDKSSKKSAGVLTGIFQLFDRRFLLSLRQHNDQYHEQSPSAADTTSLCKQGVNCREICNLEQALSGSCQENCSSFMESATRTSSSSSTLCSSLKHKLSKDEPKSSVRSPKNSAKTRSADINESPGFRESIKESIYNDLKNVSVKEKTKEGVKKNKVLKPVDSPRPIDLSKMKELEESLEVLIKLRDLPRNLHEAGCSPRFSYDGRISTDIKQVITLIEKRRLSLDSMEDSLRCDLKSKVDSLMKELEKKSNYRISEASNLHQDLKSNENHTSIVAKLMGLGPINSAGESCVKGHKPVNSQKKQESKYGNFLQSARNSPSSRSSINPHMESDSSSRLVVKETLQKTVEYAEGNMRQKIEPVHNVIEKTLQKLEFQHNKEIRDLRRVILESKNPGKTLRQTNTSEKSSISERALKSPFVGMKPESKSAGISSSQCSKLEVTSGLRKIKTSGSSDRKKEPFSVDGGQTPTGKMAKCMNSSAKAKSRREGDNSVSPRLQRKGNPDQDLKSCSVITSYDSKKNQKQSDNRQQLESVSPSSRVRQKSCKSQLSDGKSHLFHQTKRTNAASASKHKQHQILPREVVLVEELEQISPQLSSPNSVLDASPYQDDLPLSPLSVSSTSNEDENLLSNHTLKTTHPPQNLPSTSNFAKESQKLENAGTEIHKFIFPGSTTDSYTDPDNRYVAEVLLSYSLLTKDSHLYSMLKQIKLVDPLEAVEKNNTQVHHKQLVYDVVNEILARKIKAFNSGCQHDHLPKPKMLSLQLLFKELCLEVKHLQSSIDRNFQEKDTVFTKDLLWRSNARDRFDSEVPSVVSEIERLIFIDLISEIIDSSIGTVLGTKQRYRRQRFV